MESSPLTLEARDVTVTYPNGNTALRDAMKAQETRLAKLEKAVTALAAADSKPAKTTAKR